MKKLSVLLIVLVAFGCQSPLESGPSQADVDATFRTLSMANNAASMNADPDTNPDYEFEMDSGTVDFTYSEDGDTMTIVMTFDNVGMPNYPERFSGTATMVMTVTQVGNVVTINGSSTGSYSVTNGKVSQIDYSYTYTMVMDFDTGDISMTISGSAVADGKSFPISLTN